MVKSKQHMLRLKRNHQNLIVLSLQKYGTLSRAQLSKLTGLSKACVCNIVDEMLIDETLVEIGTVLGSRGRPQTLVNINPYGTPIIAAYLTWESMTTIVANSAGNILSYDTIDYDCGKITSSEMVKMLASEVRRATVSTGCDINSLGALGLAVGTSIDTLLGVTRNEEPAWDGMPLVNMVENELGIPVYAENEVRAAAMTDTWFGKDTSSGTKLYLTIAKGLGCAFINENKILRGARDLSGRIHRMIINEDGPTGRTMLGQAAGNAAFISSIWPDLAQSINKPSVSLKETDSLVRKGMDMALGGDLKAYTALTEVTRALGIGLGNIIDILDPQTVCIGGTMVDVAPNVVLDLIRRETLKHLLPDSIGVEIKPLPNWQQFILRGAVGLVLCRQFFESQAENLNSQILNPQELNSIY